MQNIRQGQLVIQYCQECHKHPELEHNQSLYQQKLHQIERQIERQNIDLRIRKQINFRKGAFEIWFKKILLYSKLNAINPTNNQIPMTINQLMMMIYCIINKSEEDIRKLKIRMFVLNGNQLKSQSNRENVFQKSKQDYPLLETDRTILDLYSYLKQNNNSKRMHLKTTNTMIETIMKSGKIENKRNSKDSKDLKQKSSRISELFKVEINKQFQNSQRKEKINKCSETKNKCLLQNRLSNRGCNQSNSSFNGKSRTNRKEKTILSKKMFLQKYNSKINIAMDMKYPSIDKKITDQLQRGFNTPQHNVPMNNQEAYKYLSAAMDKNHSVNNQEKQHMMEILHHTKQKTSTRLFSKKLKQDTQQSQQKRQIVLMELSANEETELQLEFNESTWKFQLNQYEQIKKQEGLLIRLPHNTKNQLQKNTHRPNSVQRKYSFQLNRDMEGIEKQLKSQFGSPLSDNKQATTDRKQKGNQTNKSEIQKDQGQHLEKLSVNSSGSIDLGNNNKCEFFNKKSIKNQSKKNFVSIKQIFNNQKSRVNFQKSMKSVKSINAYTNLSIDVRILTNQLYQTLEEQLANKEELYQSQKQKFLSSFSIDSKDNLVRHLSDLDLYELKQEQKNINYNNMKFKLQIKQTDINHIKVLLDKSFLEKFLEDLFSIENIYRQQFTQIFSVNQYRNISVESHLYNQAQQLLKYKQNNLDSKINLDEEFVKLHLFDFHNGFFIEVNISLAALKSITAIIRQKLKRKSSSRMQWISSILIGFFMINNFPQRQYQFQSRITKIKGQFNITEELTAPFDKLLRMITGSPSIQISTVDLRKIKKILVQSYFSKAEANQGKIICLPNQKDSHNNLVRVMKEILENSQNFTESLVKLYKQNEKQFLLQQQESGIIEYSYENFVLEFEKILISFHHDIHYHSQIIKVSHYQPEADIASMKILFAFDQIFEQTNKQKKLYFEFSEIKNYQIQRIQKQSKISVSKIIRKKKHGKLRVELEPIGQINKKGSFFFELGLEIGQYLCEISRQYENQEINCFNILSNSKIIVLASQINNENVKKYTNTQLAIFDQKKETIQLENCEIIQNNSNHSSKQIIRQSQK